ncbi:hypothetical protein Ancab_023372 [Ancistrocladus abbreviatus]
MAEAPCTAPNQELPTKLIEEISLRGDQVTERYFYKKCDSRVVPLMNSPIIDLNLLLPSSSSLEELNKSLILPVFLDHQLVNHGMTSMFLDQTREASKQFFGLPVEEKKKYSGSGFDGYGHDEKGNWNDRLRLTLLPKSKHQLQSWPDSPTKFREVLEELAEKFRIIVQVLLKATARLLNLEENSFLEQYGEEGLMLARFNYYAKCPRPDLVLGLRPHSNGTSITIVQQDKEVEGLQVLKDETKPIDALITNEQPQQYKKVKDYGKIYFELDPTGR